MSEMSKFLYSCTRSAPDVTNVWDIPACCFLCVLDVVEVLYPHRTMTLSRGSVAKLSCEAKYYLVECGMLHVAWQRSRQETELTDPTKYFTSVNETVIEANRRRRHVVTEILSLTRKDEGDFQCKAECENGDKAMGHLITIVIRGTGNKDKSLLL